MATTTFWQQHAIKFTDAINKLYILTQQRLKAELQLYADIVYKDDFATSTVEVLDQKLPNARIYLVNQKNEFETKYNDGIKKIEEQYPIKNAFDVDNLKKLLDATELFIEELRKDYPIEVRIQEVKQAEEKAKEDAEESSWYNPVSWVSSAMDFVGAGAILDAVADGIAIVTDELESIANDIVDFTQDQLNEVLPSEVASITDKAFEQTKKGINNTKFIADLGVNVTKAIVRGDNVQTIIGDTTTKVSLQVLKNSEGIDVVQKNLNKQIANVLRAVAPEDVEGVINYIEKRSDQAIEMSKQNREDALMWSAHTGENLKNTDIFSKDSLNTFVEKTSAEASQKWDKNTQAMSNTAGQMAYDVTSQVVEGVTGDEEAGKFAGAIAYVATKTYVDETTNAQLVSGVLQALSDPNASLEEKIFNAGMAYADDEYHGLASKKKDEYLNKLNDIGDVFTDSNLSTEEKISKLAKVASNSKDDGSDPFSMYDTLTDSNLSPEEKLSKIAIAYADKSSKGKASKVYNIMASDEPFENKLANVGLIIASESTKGQSDIVVNIWTDDKNKDKSFSEKLVAVKEFYQDPQNSEYASEDTETSDASVVVGDYAGDYLDALDEANNYANGTDTAQSEEIDTESVDENSSDNLLNILSSEQFATSTLPELQKEFPLLQNTFSQSQIEKAFGDKNIDFKNTPFITLIQQLTKTVAPDLDVSSIQTEHRELPKFKIPEFMNMSEEQIKALDPLTLMGIIIPYLNQMTVNDFKAFLPEELRKDFPALPDLSLNTIVTYFPELFKGIDVLSLDLIRERSEKAKLENVENKALPTSIYANLPEGNLFEAEINQLPQVLKDVGSQMSQAFADQLELDLLTKRKDELKAELQLNSLLSGLAGSTLSDDEKAEKTQELNNIYARLPALKISASKTNDLLNKVTKLTAYSQIVDQTTKETKADKKLKDLQEQIKKQQDLVNKERTYEGVEALKKPIQDKISENQKKIDQYSQLVAGLEKENASNRVGELNLYRTSLKEFQKIDSDLKDQLAFLKPNTQRDYYKFNDALVKAQANYDAVKKEYDANQGLAKQVQIEPKLKTAEATLAEANQNISWLLTYRKYTADQLLSLPKAQQDFYKKYHDDRYPAELKLADVQEELSTFQNEVSSTTIKNVNSAPVFVDASETPLIANFNVLDAYKGYEDKSVDLYILDGLAYKTNQMQSKMAFVIDPNEVIQQGKQLFHLIDSKNLYSNYAIGDDRAETNQSIVFIPSTDTSASFVIPQKGYKTSADAVVKNVLKIVDGKAYITVPVASQYADFSKLMLAKIFSSNNSADYAKLIKDVVNQLNNPNYIYEDVAKTLPITISQGNMSNEYFYAFSINTMNRWAGEKVFEVLSESVKPNVNTVDLAQKAKDASIQIVPYSKIFDADGDKIQSVKFVELPKVGRLFFDDIEIKLNDVIDVKDITQNDKFTYKPKDNAYGYDQFRIKVSDGKSYSQYSGVISVDITQANDPIVANPNTAVMKEDSDSLILSNVYFNISDVDSSSLNTRYLDNSDYQSFLGNQVQFVKISDGLRLTLNNKLLVENTKISIGQLVSLVADLKKDVDSNQFVQFKTIDNVAGETQSTSEIHQLNITVIPENDAPKITPLVKKIIVKEGESINLDDYLNLKDVDTSDDFLSLEFKALPDKGFGSISLENDTISNTKSNIKDSLMSITKANLPYLIYTAPDSIGSTKSKSFTFKMSAFDGQIESSQTQIVVSIEKNNNAPIAKSFDVKIAEDKIYKFKSSQFLFSDVEGDKAQTIKITKLPESATLSSQSKEIKLNQILKISDLDKLEIKPNENFIGNDSFSFSASDDFKTYGEESFVNWQVNSANDAPTTESINLDFYNLIDNKFDINYLKFTDNDAESDWNQFKSITIKSLPKLGTLYFKQKLVNVDSKINLIDINDLTYKTLKINPVIDNSDSFDFSVSDGLLDSKSATATINLKNHAPLSTEKNAITITMANDSTMKAEDYFTDPDGDKFTFNSIQLGKIDPISQQLSADLNQPNWIKLSADKSKIEFKFTQDDLLNIPQIDYLFLATSIDANGLISEPKPIKIKLTQPNQQVISTADLQISGELNKTIELPMSNLKLSSSQGTILGTNFKALLAITNMPDEVILSVNPNQNAKNITLDGQGIQAFDFNSIQKLSFKLPNLSELNHDSMSFKLIDPTSLKPLSESFDIDINYLATQTSIENSTNINTNLSQSNENQTTLNVDKNVFSLDGSDQTDAWDINLDNVSTNFKGTPFDDLIQSSSKTDTIDGALGQDLIILNQSNDLIILANSENSADIIQNFSINGDKLVLSKTNFNTISQNNLESLISFEVIDGNTEIYYQVDKNTSIKIATLEGVSNLSINDFTII